MFESIIMGIKFVGWIVITMSIFLAVLLIGVHLIALLPLIKPVLIIMCLVYTTVCFGTTLGIVHWIESK